MTAPPTNGRASARADVLLACSSDLLTAHAADGTVLYANAACERILGLPAEDLIGTNPLRLVHPDDRAQLIAHLVALRGDPRAVIVLRLRARHADGSYRFLEGMARNGLDDPALGCVLVSTRDVSERTLAEQATRTSELRHRQLVESAPIGLAVVDSEGLLRFVNPAAFALVGLPPQASVLGHRPSDLVLPEEQERCLEQLNRALLQRDSPGASEYHVVQPQGLPLVVQSLPLPYLWNGEPGALLMLQDVTPLRRLEAERNAVSRQLGQLLEATAEGMLGVDVDGRLSFINPAAEAMLGLRAVDVLGAPTHELFHHSYADGTPYPQHLCPMLGAARKGRPAQATGEVFWRSDGTSVPVEYRAVPLRTDEPSGAVVSFRDITEGLRASALQAELAAFQRAVLDSLPALTAVVDASGVILAANRSWNEHAEERGGSSAACGVGVDILAVLDAVVGAELSEARAVAAGLRSVLDGRSREYQQDIPCHYLDSDYHYFALHMVPLDTPDGGAVISYTDITLRKSLEVEAAHRATHDVLTELPNRTLFLDRLTHALEHRGPPAVALLFLDLDAFKLVNDGYGHEAGDQVLRELADRLCHQLRPFDTVARLAGDEFVVLCEQINDEQEVRQLADRLIDAVGKPFVVSGAPIMMGVSIGIAMATELHGDAADLLRAADQAMFAAKARGRNRYAVYDRDIRGSSRQRLEQAAALRRLVDRHQLLVHYQPVIDLRDGHLAGSEALLRWTREPTLVDTAQTIALAEEVGLMGRIGSFVLTEALAQGATFVDADGLKLPLSVNLAPQQLDATLVGQVEQAADDAGYPLSALTLELTEHSLVVERRLSVDVLRALRARGVKIALDDFGVGYSSLAYLQDLPLDVLKIDASFVRGLVGRHADDRLVKAIVAMAKALGLEIVAEGIEVAEQQERLLELGCLRGQGFLYSRARPPADLRARALSPQGPPA